MANVTTHDSETELAKSEAIKEVCEQVSEPARIWEALESKGIEATPGVVYQAINDLGNAEEKTSCKNSALEIRVESGPGLTAQDLEAIATWAEKAGGVDELIRVLSVMHRAPK